MPTRQYSWYCIRHARPCAVHPRLTALMSRKTWMAGTSPAMTKSAFFHPLRRIIRFLAVEDALQGCEVPLGRGRSLVEIGSANFALCLLDPGVGQLLERLPGPHRVDLNLGGALDVIEPVIGIGDALADGRDPVIGHEQHGLVADHLGETRALGGIERRAGIFIVIRNLAGHPDLGLADLLDARIFEPRQRARIGHVGMKHSLGLRQRLVDRRMDAIAGAFHLALAALDLAVIDADFHERGRRYLRPMHPEWDLAVTVAAPRHHQGQMVEDAFAKAVHEGQPMRGGKVNPRPPFLGAAVAKRLRRNPELHECPPFLDGFLCPVLYRTLKRSSLPGLTRQSIQLKKFLQSRWMRGS